MAFAVQQFFLYKRHATRFSSAMWHYFIQLGEWTLIKCTYIQPDTQSNKKLMSAKYVIFVQRPAKIYLQYVISSIHYIHTYMKFILTQYMYVPHLYNSRWEKVYRAPTNNHFLSNYCVTVREKHIKYFAKRRENYFSLNFLFSLFLWTFTKYTKHWHWLLCMQFCGPSQNCENYRFFFLLNNARYFIDCKWSITPDLIMVDPMVLQKCIFVYTAKYLKIISKMKRYEMMHQKMLKSN